MFGPRGAVRAPFELMLPLAYNSPELFRGDGQQAADDGDEGKPLGGVQQPWEACKQGL
jgi:hypothetical protein